MEFRPNLQTELIANAGCYRCDNPNDLVDFDKSIHFEGVLCICKNCIVDAARAAGMDLVQGGLVEDLEASKAALSVSNAEVERLRGILAELGSTAAAREEQDAEEAAIEQQRRAEAITAGRDPVTGTFLSKEERDELLREIGRLDEPVASDA